jgi:2-polyprenyl-3-methyl-5-hydroxy-6-metoxy-1,4-benzoquinol methylase
MKELLKQPGNQTEKHQLDTVRQWWDEHPMDYQGYSRKELKTDNDYRAFFRSVDAAWWSSTKQINSSSPAHLGDRLLNRSKISGRRVLEIGCGMGTWTQAFVEWGCDVTAIDLAPYSVEMTRKRLELAGLKANVMEMDARDMRALGDQFDFIWSWGVIHHSPDTEQIVKEIHRLLKPGGEFGIMVYYKYSIHSTYLFLRFGLMRGEIFNYGWQNLQSRYSEGEEYGGPPLARSWSKIGFKKLLAPLIVDRISYHSDVDVALMLLPSRFGIGNLAQKIVPLRIKELVTRRLGHAMYAYGHKELS